MDENKLYYIKRDARTKEGKDTPWLMAYKDSGMTETAADGTKQPVYTCLWGCRMRDARPFEDENIARIMAKKIGGCVVISVKKGATE